MLLLNAPVSTPAWPGALQLGWRTGSSWLLDCHDEEAGQLDKGPEDSTEGAQGAGSSSDSTSGQREYDCDDEEMRLGQEDGGVEDRHLMGS